MNGYAWKTLALCLTSAWLAAPGMTQADEAEQPLGVPQLSPCSERYPLVAMPRPSLMSHDPRRAIREGFNTDREWGTEDNAELIPPAVTGLNEPGLRVLYPEGSSSPSDADRNDTARGGLGFYTEEPALTAGDRACLKYRVRFAPGFDFVKGGKLPGLYGNDAPSGGEDVDGENGFSMRFMWREEGQGELYPYVVGHEGESVGRGRWNFPTGRWVSIEQEVVLNTPGREDGVVRVWIDGRPVLEQRGVVYRNTEHVRIDGLMFSTFFGGTGKGWRTPRDQSVDFAAFRLYAPGQ